MSSYGRPSSQGFHQPRDYHQDHQEHRADPSLFRGEAGAYYDENQSFFTKKPRRDHRAANHNGHCSNDGAENPRYHHERHRHSRSPSPMEERHECGYHAIFKHGLFGTLKGMRELALRRPRVYMDTPERLDLLKRADKFFNSGLIGKLGGLSRHKRELFREEIDRIRNFGRGGRHSDEQVRPRWLRDMSESEPVSRDDSSMGGRRSSEYSEASHDHRSRPKHRGSQNYDVPSRKTRSSYSR